MFSTGKSSSSKSAETPPFLPFGEILGSCCGTWHNFMHLYFTHHWTSHCWWLGRKAPPPQDEGNFFDIRPIHFRQFTATLVFVAEKPLPPGWGNIFWHRIYTFQTILSNFGFCGRKAPPMREIVLTSDLSISGNFQQLWFLWQKRPPTRMRDHFLTADLSISGNFQQLWFLSQKSTPPPRWGKIFDIRSMHFRQFPATLVFVAEKHPTPQMREKFLTLNLSISGKFEQLWSLWQKSPPSKDEGNFFDIRSIHFRQFSATLVLVAEKPPPLVFCLFIRDQISPSSEFSWNTEIHCIFSIQLNAKYPVNFCISWNALHILHLVVLAFSSNREIHWIFSI